ncbi:aminodeoxychorismate synthase component I [Desulfolucanica intricata]|uniref:aminodeoxychorismate synthase component I n=1 Tax=Desulfolucanica intricata TaxID=1285191 RepID=UPI00082D38CD|nr:aminodeoxychorismate synthase component I [Desulfolucanica intricata]
MTTLPLIKKLSVSLTAETIHDRLHQRPYSFFLDTGMRVEGLGHHSFVGADPFLVFESKGSRITVTQNGQQQVFTGHPFKELKKLLELYKLPRAQTGLPFNGGAVGFFGYDLGRGLEVIPSLAEDDTDLPDCRLGFYDVLVGIDHLTGEVSLVSTGLPEKAPDRALARATARLEEVEKIISGPAPRRKKAPPAKSAGLPESHFTEQSYCAAVQRAIDYIATGDIFIVNLSQRFSTPQTMDSWKLYRKLRDINPAPFAAFLGFDEIEVICASPERFLKVTDKLVETRPIKGTRPRGKTRAEDAALRRELWESKKDRAELVMIVDLERNDLGRVCKTGSVQVPELYRLEEYPTVFHLVSTVVGELPEDKDVVDLLEASFPGGSITGAPKIRSMEIIEELEPVRRGIYTGSIGYIGFDGDADLNIVIRTLVAKNGRLYFQVGGGITADSVPYKEYIETLDKARALMRALGLEEEVDYRWSVSSV